jgi:hypothetical protein
VGNFDMPVLVGILSRLSRHRLQPGDHEDMATAAQELPQAVDHAVNDLRHSIAALSMQSAAPPPIMTAAQ